MKVFIWEDVAQVSHAYHPKGGLVVIASTEEMARQLANEQNGVSLSPEEKPTVYELFAEYMPTVFIFPNAGCC